MIIDDVAFNESDEDDAIPAIYQKKNKGLSLNLLVKIPHQVNTGDD